MTQSAISILWLVGIVAVFYFFIFRPQMNRQREQMALIASLAEGDHVVTAGGMYGTIRAVEEDAVEVEIAPNVVVRLAKGAIARKLEA